MCDPRGRTRRLLSLFRLLRRQAGHLERLPQRRTLSRLQRVCPIEPLAVAFPISLHRNHPHIDRHVIPQILESRDKRDAVFVLKTDTAGMVIVDAIEVLDRCYDGIGGVMRVDLHSHRYPSTNLGVLIQQQLKSHILRHWSLGTLVLRSSIRSRLLRPCVLGTLHNGQHPVKLIFFFLSFFFFANENHSKWQPDQEKKSSIGCSLSQMDGGSI